MSHLSGLSHRALHCIAWSTSTMVRKSCLQRSTPWRNFCPSNWSYFSHSGRYVVERKASVDHAPIPPSRLAVGAQSVALPLMSEEELPIFGKATLHKFWQYLFTYYYNSYTYSHDTVSDLGDGFDHGNTAVWIMSNHQVWCSCAEAWEFGNFTWFTPGDVSYSPGVVLPTDNPGACCNFLVEPRCGDEPFGRSLWCPVDLSSCTSANGDPVTDHATVHKYMRTVPQDVAHGTAALLANNLTHWSFCTSSFSDFFVMDGKPTHFLIRLSRTHVHLLVCAWCRHHTFPQRTTPICRRATM